MGITGNLQGLAAGIAAFAAFALPAFADIKAYNAAVLRGDYAAATLEAETVWTTFDKARPETAATAREFAWTAMLAGQNDNARVYAKFLIEEGPHLATPDDEPLMAKLLLQWADLGKEPAPATATTFSDTLKSWAASNTAASRVAAVAAAQLYSREWNMGKWEAVRRDAPIAASLAARLGREGMVIEERARVDAAAAQFLDDKKVGAWLALADVHDEMMDRMGPPVPGEKVDDLDAIDMRIHAWLEAMSAYFGAGLGSMNASMARKRQYEQIEVREKTLKNRCPEKECKLVEAGAAPPCPATWEQTPPLNYPANALFRGMVGATILDMTTDEKGAVTAYKVLAAVPSDTFPAATTKVVQKWSLKRKKDAVEPCTLAGTRQLHVIFQMP